MSTINTNVSSLNAQRALASTSLSMSTSMQRLSSGLRVNSAKDDAAGLAIAERMQAQTNGMNVAVRNSNDAISMAQTAEGALGSISKNLLRMRDLAVQASTGTNNTAGTDNGALDKEFQLLAQENKRIADGTKFNGQDIITTGAADAKTFQFQIGANNTDNDRIQIEADGFEMAETNILTAGSAQSALDTLDTAIDAVTTARSEWGATQNRLEAVIVNLRTSAENSAAASGRIMDTDYAAETANLSRSQVLQQAGQAMVAQANQLPQGVLSLLKG